MSEVLHRQRAGGLQLLEKDSRKIPENRRDKTWMYLHSSSLHITGSSGQLHRQILLQSTSQGTLQMPPFLKKKS